MTDKAASVQAWSLIASALHRHVLTEGDLSVSVRLSDGNLHIECPTGHDADFARILYRAADEMAARVPIKAH